MTNTQDTHPEAGPSITRLAPGPSPYHESSQHLHWRYSPSQLSETRQALNQKSVEVVRRNVQLEKEAQQSLGKDAPPQPPSSTYLTVEDELLLLRFYLEQASQICRKAFGLPEVAEATALTYLKRFFLKNSVMEWHPKNIMPTCIFLAAKTTNNPIPLEHFTPKMAKLTASDILDTEFLLAQSLSFEFWVRGAERAVRGWGLELQTQPSAQLDLIQKTLTSALQHLQTSRLTDLEFTHTPSQIALACFRLSNALLIDAFLEWKYRSYDSASEGLLYGIERHELVEIIMEIEGVIVKAGGVIDLKKVKEIDKRLKGCSNPEKVPGTALYIKRKRDQEELVVAAKAQKTLKARAVTADREMVFGEIIRPDRKPLSPRVKLDNNIGIAKGDGFGVRIQDSGMGVRDEAMGMIFGGTGLKEVGKELDDA